MIITCPECQTRYKASEEAIGINGRTVRCASCTATWFVPAPHAEMTLDELALDDFKKETVTPLEAPKTQEPKVKIAPPVTTKNPQVHNAQGAHVEMRDKADRRRRNQRLRIVAAIWLIPLLLLSAGAYGAYHYRQNIVEAYPKAATFYKAIGWDVSLSGLMLNLPETRYADVDGRPVLIVTGTLRNLTQEVINVPMIGLTLHDGDETVLAEWQVDLETTRLGPKERAEYLTQYPNPPLDAVELRTRLVSPEVVETETPIQMPDMAPEPSH